MRTSALKGFDRMDKKSKILVVDDETKIVEVVESYLEKEGYTAVSANNGREALEVFRREEPDLVILDLMMPDMDGWEVCKRIRAMSNVPIIMLTAKSQVDDRIEGLSIGADDYVLKPFSPRELVARVRAILRRIEDDGRAADILSFDEGRLKIDTIRHQVVKDGNMLELTKLEFNILKTLASNPGRVYSREMLINAVLGYDYDGYDRTIDTHIKNIRNKIEDDKKEPRYIKTIYGAGYKFGG
jgi:two-component system OmpR family response regulator